MDSQTRRALFFLAVIVVTFTHTESRAVNISNTWMLPEEGFPVFYRYFRDRISWYEADAVCQFHHANLVTADSTSQYDAIRAYLKELDITESVWIGLSKTSEKPNFTWTDFRPLTGDGHWQEAIPVGVDAVCVEMDPNADFLWKARSCGGPEVAAFICELPIPIWASGPKGCLPTELPSLTVLYIPEQSAIELTSDCGLDGTKRIACKGDADREDMLKQLTCSISNEDFDQITTTKSATSEATATTEDVPIKTTKPWIWTSNTIEVDYGLPTRHRRETEDTLSPVSTKSTRDLVTKQTDFGERVGPRDQEQTTSSNYATMETTEVDNTQSTSGLTQASSDEENRSQDPTQTTQMGMKTDDVPVAGSAEFPSAISQGQLFSIIENGTMFDIIELNDTQDKPELTTATPSTLSPAKPSKKVQKTDKSSKLTKKDIYKQSDSKKRLTKETEMYPIVNDNSPHLNRTLRKEVPVDHTLEPPTNTPTTNAPTAHQHIEIQLTNQNASLFVTTKRLPNFDPNNQILANNVEVKASNKSEFFVPPTPFPSNQTPDDSFILKEQLLPKSLIGEETTPNATPTPLPEEPDTQPRPNRQRQLTRPQRRSFYPYFFSRVLG